MLTLLVETNFPLTAINAKLLKNFADLIGKNMMIIYF